MSEAFPRGLSNIRFTHLRGVFLEWRTLEIVSYYIIIVLVMSLMYVAM